MFGSHKNIHTGPAEHNHIENSKKPSLLTQKSKKLFDWQLANRLNEKTMIDLALNKIQKHMAMNIKKNTPQLKRGMSS